jgi:uncharacterized protein involved in copper resistance
MMLIVVVGLSVALLPAAAGFSAGTPQAAPAAVTMSASAMPDCDHHMHAPSGKTQKSDSDGMSMNGCVFQCFSFTGVAAADVSYAPAAGKAPRVVQISDRLSPQTGSLPFRPPRI